MNAVESQHMHAAKGLIWQWFFPANQLTSVQKAATYRRSHVHATHLQQAIQEAVGKARIDQRAPAHTLRHRVASHWLQANDETRTIRQ